MKLPSGKLLALVAIFAAIGLVTATGAFTTVSAQRTATVNVAGDSSALLALNPTNEYASLNSGQLEINLAGTDESGERAAGVNLNANTDLGEVFSITNQGTQPVSVHIAKTGNNSETVSFTNGTNDIDGGSGNAVTLGVGETTNVSITIDTVGEDLSKGDQLLSSITIYANASDASS